MMMANDIPLSCDIVNRHQERVHLGRPLCPQQHSARKHNQQKHGHYRNTHRPGNGDAFARRERGNIKFIWVLQL